MRRAQSSATAAASTRCRTSPPGRDSTCAASQPQPAPRSTMRVGSFSGRCAASASEAGSGASAENTPGRVTKPGAASWSRAAQSAGSQPASGGAMRKILPCARDWTSSTEARPRNSFSMESTPSVFCPSIHNDAPGRRWEAASWMRARASARARGRNTTAPSKAPSAAVTGWKPCAFNASTSGNMRCTICVRAGSKWARSLCAPAPINKKCPSGGKPPNTSSSRELANFLTLFPLCIAADAAGDAQAP
ncbi:hypothetical protein D3C76_1155960 [compost metagenome]